MQTRCSILPSIADKMKHESPKSTRVKQCLLTARWHVTKWCNRLAVVWLLPPCSSSFSEAFTAITVPNFPIPSPIVNKAYWLARCLAMNVLLFRAFASTGICLPESLRSNGSVRHNTFLPIVPVQFQWDIFFSLNARSTERGWCHSVEGKEMKYPNSRQADIKKEGLRNKYFDYASWFTEPSNMLLVHMISIS
jgi:hypothetical protein